MKVHTTNYFSTFIEVAEDCPVTQGEIPPQKGDEKTLANLQYEMISKQPYQFTSDEVLFHCFATKKEVIESEMEAERAAYFSKGQPCFRSSPLTKRYGWGVHSNTDGKVAIFGVETKEYQQLTNDKTLKTVKAMRSKKA